MSPEGPNTYFDVPGVATVRWDPSMVTVIVEWAGYADPTEFTALLDAELRAIREHYATRLLADCRLQQVLDAGAQDWGDREWLPRALAAGLKRFAIVLPASELAAQNLEDHLGRVPSSSLQVGYFDTIEKARAWLSKT